MKETEIVISSSNIIDITLLQAFSYFEEAEQMIFNSQFNLYDEQEDLDDLNTIKRYNEKNRRLTQLGQACEYFLKTILLIEKRKTQPGISAEQLWDKTMRGHKIDDLFQRIEFLNTNFRKFFSERAMSDVLDLSLTEEDLFQMLTTNSAVYEKSRYSMQKKTNYDLMEVLKLTRKITMVAMECYDNYSGKNISIVHQISPMIASELEFELSFLDFSDEQKKKILDNINRWSRSKKTVDGITKDASFLSSYKFLTNEIDLSDDEVVKILAVPSAIFRNPKTYIKQIKFLIDNDLRFILTVCPNVIFFHNLESLNKTLKYLVENKLDFIIRNFPEIMIYSKSSIEEKMNFLSENGLENLLIKFPKIFAYNQSYIEKIIKYFDTNDLRFVLEKYPQLLMINLSNLKTKMYYLQEKGIIINESNYSIIFVGKTKFCKLLNISEEDFIKTFKYFEEEDFKNQYLNGK